MCKASGREHLVTGWWGWQKCRGVFGVWDGTGRLVWRRWVLRSGSGL